MPALNFQARFADLVERGEKRQTIRAWRRDGRDPYFGNFLYLFTGMRTPACRPLRIRDGRGIHFAPVAHRGSSVVYCRGAGPIRIDFYRERTRIAVYHRPLDADAALEMARADGFADVEDMAAWFAKTHGLPFEGLLIRW